MGIESFNIIINGIIEIVKYLGPAIVTAIFGYTVGKSQIKGRIKELEQTNAYFASQKLFEYYQNREKELEDSYNSINKDLGFLIGLNIALDSNADQVLLNEKNKNI